MNLEFEFSRSIFAHLMSKMHRMLWIKAVWRVRCHNWKRHGRVLTYVWFLIVLVLSNFAFFFSAFTVWNLLRARAFVIPQWAFVLLQAPSLETWRGKWPGNILFLSRLSQTLPTAVLIGLRSLASHLFLFRALLAMPWKHQTARSSLWLQGARVLLFDLKLLASQYFLNNMFYFIVLM